MKMNGLLAAFSLLLLSCCFACNGDDDVSPAFCDKTGTIQTGAEGCEFALLYKSTRYQMVFGDLAEPAELEVGKLVKFSGEVVEIPTICMIGPAIEINCMTIVED